MPNTGPHQATDESSRLFWMELEPKDGDLSHVESDAPEVVWEGTTVGRSLSELAITTTFLVEDVEGASPVAVRGLDIGLLPGGWAHLLRTL